jgi:hypothetical protein
MATLDDEPQIEWREEIEHHLFRGAPPHGAPAGSTTAVDGVFGGDRDKDNLPDAIDLLSRSSEWLEIIRWYSTKLNSAIEAGSE